MDRPTGEAKLTNLIIGGLTAVGGMGMLLAHFYYWTKPDSSEPSDDLMHRKRFRWRTIACGGFALLGLCIMALDRTKGSPYWFTVIVMVALMLILVILSAATLDFLGSIEIYRRRKRELSRSHREMRKEIESLVDEHRKSKEAAAIQGDGGPDDSGSAATESGEQP